MPQPGPQGYILADFKANPVMAGDLLAERVVFEFSKGLLNTESVELHLQRDSQHLVGQEWAELTQHGWSATAAEGLVTFHKPVLGTQVLPRA